MKKSFLYTAISFMLFATFSCSNEFLNNNMEQEDFLPSNSQIIISPVWDMADYQFDCPLAGNADFTVANAPEWLEIETGGGKLVESIGAIRCKAKINPQFEKTGFYLDKIDISVNGRIYYVPLQYASGGNPQISVNTTLAVNNHSSFLNVRNTGGGMLLWYIISKPEWVEAGAGNLYYIGTSLLQGDSCNLPVKLTSNMVALMGDLTGSIVLKTNDKNNLMVSIAVTADLGTPRLQINSMVLDFRETTTIQLISLYNHGAGLLVWSFEGLPEWLSAVNLGGVLSPYSSSEKVIFTADRSLLPEGLSTATYYINDLAYKNFPKTKTGIPTERRLSGYWGRPNKSAAGNNPPA